MTARGVVWFRRNRAFHIVSPRGWSFLGCIAFWSAIALAVAHFL